VVEHQGTQLARRGGHAVTVGNLAEKLPVGGLVHGNATAEVAGQDGIGGRAAPLILYLRVEPPPPDLGYARAVGAEREPTVRELTLNSRLEGSTRR
jgi:hypothetical protein